MSFQAIQGSKGGVNEDMLAELETPAKRAERELAASIARNR
jgi:hypothetical protein